MLLDAYTLAAFLTATGTPTKPATIRKWTQRGHITARGRDRRGRALYDPREVARHARGTQAVAPREHDVSQ